MTELRNNVAPPGTCPDSEALSAWIAGGTRPEEAARIERHVGECRDCGALVQALRPRNGRRWVLAAASVLFIGWLGYAFLSGRPGALERARSAVQEGNDLAAYEWLATYVASAEGSPAWEELVECLAGPPGEPVERPRFRDGGPERGGIYPAGTLSTPTPDFLATPGDALLRLEVVRADAPETTPLLSLELPASTERRAYPEDQPPLAPGPYELHSKGPDGEGGMHAFRIVVAPSSWSLELRRIDESLADADLRRLCRAHAMIRAGLEGNALRELCAWTDAPPAVVRWREDLVRSLCWQP